MSKAGSKAKGGKSAFDKAVDLLSRRQQTEAELRRKLRQRGYENGEIGEAIARLVELKYVDDDRTAGEWAAELAGRGGMGRRRAAEKLIARGIEPALVRGKIDAVWDDELEREHASRALQKLLRSSRFPSHGPRRNAKLWRALASRGFNPGIIRILLEELERNSGEGDIESGDTP